MEWLHNLSHVVMRSYFICMNAQGQHDEGQQSPRLCEENGTLRGAPRGSLRGCRETSEACISGKRKAHELKKNPRDTGRVSLEHPAGQTGVYRPVSQGFPVICYRKTDTKGHFCRDTGRVSQGRPAIQGVFRNFMYFFLMRLFCSLIL